MKKGFTLIELLIVIAIIGILASIVLVSLSSARQRAKMSEFKATVSSLNAAAVVDCDAGSITTAIWPTNNNSGSITTAITCTGTDPGSEIAGGIATSNSAVTGTSCVATLGQEGVSFAATGC